MLHDLAFGPVDPAMAQRLFTVHLMGGGTVTLGLELSNLFEVAETMARQRALIGHLAPPDGFGDAQWIPALIPASRIQMVLDHAD